MFVYTLEQRFAKWYCDRLTEDDNFGKKKSSFQMQLILILVDILTSKIVAFGIQTTCMHELKNRRIQNELLFDADFGSAA